MNEDLLRYKNQCITFVLLFGYAFLHTQLSGIYERLSFEGLINFSVRLPFGQRLLVPALANLLGRVLPLKPDKLFFLLEELFISLFYFALFKLLQLEFSRRQSQLLSWLFILLLPLITMINYRFQNKVYVTFFYPSDTAALFFMAMGFLLCLRKQWFYFIPWVFLATFNRESSILLVLMVPALHWQKLRTVLIPMFSALIAYVLARLLILQFLDGVPGKLLEWYPFGGGDSNFSLNLIWLLNYDNFLLFMFCFAGLPLFWFAFYDFIPLQYRPLRYVALFYFLGLLMVGHFMEARIFAEIVIILYLPVCIALKNWLTELEPVPAKHLGFVYYVDRYAVLGILFVIVIFRQLLNKVLIWMVGLA